ncbi:MAG: glycosyltransferase [Alphaproteobacteria bacterium]|nr:glycosyltransferase [Alphaproteobacteria bacterium]
MSAQVAVLIPCYNEAEAIAAVVQKAKQVLPAAKIYVYDNNSTDNTAQIAARAGAIVRFVRQQGKGSVVRRMFADIDADIYVMTDGDMTYDLDTLPHLIDTLLLEHNDMVVGTRKEQQREAYRFGHRFGNVLLTFLVRILFGIKQTDMLSGLRVFSKRFVKTFPACSNGFEIETELNVFTAMNKLPYAEVETNYFARPEGSFSKLSTIKDGFKILFMILRLFYKERPAIAYSLPALFFAFAALILSVLGLDLCGAIWSFPPAFLSFIGFLLFGMYGVYANKQTENKREISRLLYLSYPFKNNDDNS